jgi:hypothetical protein
MVAGCAALGWFPVNWTEEVVASFPFSMGCRWSKFQILSHRPILNSRLGRVWSFFLLAAKFLQIPILLEIKESSARQRTCANCRWSADSSAGKQCLNFLPLPQGHGSLRPTFLPSRTKGAAACLRCARKCLISRFMEGSIRSCCSMTSASLMDSSVAKPSFVANNRTGWRHASATAASAGFNAAHRLTPQEACTPFVDYGVCLFLYVAFEKQGLVDILNHALHNFVVKHEDGTGEFSDFLLIQPFRALVFATPDGGHPARGQDRIRRAGQHGKKTIQFRDVQNGIIMSVSLQVIVQ